MVPKLLVSKLKKKKSCSLFLYFLTNKNNNHNWKKEGGEIPGRWNIINFLSAEFWLKISDIFLFSSLSLELSPWLGSRFFYFVYLLMAMAIKFPFGWHNGQRGAVAIKIFTSKLNAKRKAPMALNMNPSDFIEACSNYLYGSFFTVLWVKIVLIDSLP